MTPAPSFSSAASASTIRSICCGEKTCRSREPRQDDVLGAELEEDAVQLLVVVDVLLALLALDLVERRLGDVDVAAVEEAAHLAVEEREEERADVRAVHVGVGHDDDLVVAGLLDVEARPRPRRRRCRCRWR